MKNFRSFLKESQNIDSFVETHINFFTNVLKNKEKNSSKSVVCFFDLDHNIIHQLSSFEHIQWLSLKFAWVAKELEEFEESQDDERRDFENSLDPDEHPGWHTYEYHSHNDREEKYADIIKEVGTKHHIYRVGFYKSNMDLSPHVENQIDIFHKMFLKNLASDLEFKLKFAKS